VQDRTIVTMTD